MNRKVTGVGLLSGGLDSILAVKVLQKQGIEVLGITFITPFFGADAAIESGREAGIDVLPIDISATHLQMLKSPKYGYGSQINPCIDCHGLMLREAGKVMEARGADFLFTGEVLGQRPMSQRRDSLRSVEKLSGYPGLVLRPLSAKLLAPTLVEERGLVDREGLLDIQGRSRKRQVALAREFGIVDYPQPGGGCMLTKEGFAGRLKALLQIHPGAAPADVEILKWGRAFLLPEGGICIVGRQHDDNARLEKLARPEDLFLRSSDRPGPTCIVLGPGDPLNCLQQAARIVASYSDSAESLSIPIFWKHNAEHGILQVKPELRAAFKSMLIP